MKNCGKDQEYLKLNFIFNAITENTPPPFCWKSYSNIPDTCPSTHPYRVLALCYKTCE